MVRIFPEYIDFFEWGCALIADNSASYLPVPPRDESKWQEWGAIVAGTGIFRLNRVPSPFSVYKGNRKDNFKDWREWARIVYLLFNDGSQILEV